MKRNSLKCFDSFRHETPRIVVHVPLVMNNYT